VDFYEKLFDTTANEKGEYHSSINIGGLWLTIDAAGNIINFRTVTKSL
jgi:hypothetical protein